MDTNEQDPDSLAADHMNIDENADMIELNLNLDDLVESATLESIKISLDFIQELKAASLDDGHLSPEVLSRLKNPPSDAIDLTAGEQFSLELFFATHDSPQHVYTSVKKVIERQYPQSELLSLEKVKQLTVEITGVSPITDDMCINSCVAFTGPYKALSECPVCGACRFDSQRRPRQVFTTIPVGPQLQALTRNKDKAIALRYRMLRTESLLSELENNDGLPKNYTDFFDGSQYLEAHGEGLIKEDDIVLMLSLDGAQLYASKQSDCWICIWVVLSHSPGVRYKKPHVLPAFVIPGPNPPRIMDSFLFRSLQHLSALQKDGLPLWDASKVANVTSNPFFALGTADGPGLTYMNGLVGHKGKNGCRLYCGVLGRRKPRDSHYYPALLKPLPPYDVEGCNHPDPDFNDPDLFVPSVAKYQEHLRLLVRSPNETRYKANRLETGIVKPSIFLGLDEKHCVPVPLCFGSDIMHHCCLNLPDLLIPLWRGTFDCSSTDKRSNWDWAVLTGNTWIEHGNAVAAATPYLPGSFDRPPRNPALKISSGYKAWEFLMYMYGLGPGVFYGVLPTPYYQNLCDLIYGVRILNQYNISSAQLLQADGALKRFAQGFEELYYQRRVDRLHFVRQSIHQCFHMPWEVTRVGPLIISSQWTMERTIGSLTQELRQPSNPYANLAQRALLRCQINALKNIVPDLVEPAGLPRGAIDLSDGYVLLRRRDTTARPLLPTEKLALVAYLGAPLGTQPQFSVIRWGRLRLPTGQIARSLWVESKPLEKLRMARNIKVSNKFYSIAMTESLCKFTQGGITQVAEVRFYFVITIGSQDIALACVSCYSQPHEGLLQASRGTLWSSKRQELIQVINIKSISAVVAMVPHQPFPGEERFFLVEKPGLEATIIGGNEEMDVD